MRTIYYLISAIIFLSSCNEGNKKRYTLEYNSKNLSFILDNNTKNLIYTLQPYYEINGNEYLSFQSGHKNEILIYNIKNKQLEFKISPEIEGGDGVGFFLGYYLHNLDSIFLTNKDIQEIALVDKNSKLKDKIQYDETNKGETLTHSYSITSYYEPIKIIENKMYIISGCNRWVEKDPVSVTIDLNSKEVKSLPFYYPNFKEANNNAKKGGMEEYFSRDFDGENFIYSFFFDENIFVTNMDHTSIKKIKIKSEYINKVKLLDDYGNLTPEDACSNPNYGNLIYDKYRNVYYRIAYPKTEIEKGVRGLELRSYGRKLFSIIILDKNFNIIGESLFPKYTYNSNLLFIHKDGLYISDSHYLNPEFSDDVLSFKCFKLTKNR